MKTPYSSLPRTANWKRSVTNTALDEISPTSPPPFKISKTDQIVSSGSCFAQHISRYLHNSGYNAYITEPPHPTMTPEIATRFNFGTYSARYGNIYVPRHLKQLFLRVYDRFSPAEDIWIEGDRFVDPFRPQIQPGGFFSRAEYDAERRTHFAAVREAFENLNIFVFTLGLTESWLSKEDGAVFPLCPGVSGGVFDPDQHEFHNFSVDEIVADMADFITLLREVNPNAKIILTVSPVPLVATASGDHVLAATTYSKSVLRVAAQMLRDRIEAVYYFPSYEIITCAASRGKYFEKDLRSVKKEGVDHVMRVFFETLTEGATPRPAPVETPQHDDISEAERLTKLACDEEMLESAMKRSE